VSRLKKKQNTFTHVFDPDCADNYVVNAAVYILPRVGFTVPTFT